MSEFVREEEWAAHALDEKGSDDGLLGVRIGRLALRIHHKCVRVRAVRDPHLVPVQHILVAYTRSKYN